ncbi:MAG: ABC transporter ATP-binding protein, partial [Proteobacteria bacterium]|nr:ABC transporter ATP-binding protein [Pseudomonadota bacterium]
MISRLFDWLERFSEPFPDSLPGKPPNSFIGFVFHYARPFWRLLLISAILSTTIALIEVYLFSFVGNLIDWLGSSDQTTFWQDHRLKLMGIGFVILVVLPILKFSYELIVHQGLLGNFAMRTRWQAHRYLLRQSVEFFQDDFAGRIAAKMMQTSLGVREAVMKVTEVLLYVTVYFFGAVLLFASSDIRLTAPMLVWLAGYILSLRYFIPKLRLISKEQAEARSMVTGRVVDSYTNIATVKMFAHAKYEDDYAREGMDIFLDSVHRQMRLATILSTTLSTMNALLLFSIAAVAVSLWQINAITAGAVAFSIGLVIRLQGMSQWIMWEISGLFENVGVVMDGIETISQDVSIDEHNDAKPLKKKQEKIEYKHIHFNYGKERTAIDHNSVATGIIDDLSLLIHAGEKIGIVGRSGAGKSTLVSLLLRFYDLEQGSINIDDIDISSISQDSLRAQIGMVTQDTSLLHRSVFDNIRYGRADTSMEEVIAAAKKAKADEFIHDLEDPNGRRGYQAHVGERGIKLSGGQRQRIAIARVLLKDAPILVLDEATSALDSEIEAAIQESLYSLMQGKTVIAIAHRLSTIAAMDRLIIMDDGKIVEQG